MEREQVQTGGLNFLESFKEGTSELSKSLGLRYGTNPHQKASLYVPSEGLAPIGNMIALKSGAGISQTNVEDVDVATRILKYYPDRAVACVMKHLNPCGVAVGLPGETLDNVFKRAWNCDSRASFGGVVVFNGLVTKEVASSIMLRFVEVLVAPEYSEDALEILCSPNAKRNKRMRVLQFGEGFFDMIRFDRSGSGLKGMEARILQDGSLIVADSYQTSILSGDDLLSFSRSGFRTPSESELKDLLCAWRVNGVARSNSVVIAKNLETLAIGVGGQDRVGMVELVLQKFQSVYKGTQNLNGSVASSDGFFPFVDSMELLANAGVRAVVYPGGGGAENEKIDALCKQKDIAQIILPERCFAH